jgi:hypothetical protein
VKLDEDMYDTTGALTFFKPLGNSRVYDLWEHFELVLRKGLPKSIKVIRFDLNNYFSKGLVQRVLALALKKMEICCSCNFEHAGPVVENHKTVEMTIVQRIDSKLLDCILQT